MFRTGKSYVHLRPIISSLLPPTNFAASCLAEKGGNPELVRESQRRRFADPKVVDEVIELDGQWRDGEMAAPRRQDI